MTPRAILLDLFQVAVAAAQPARRLPPFLPPPPRGKTVVIGAGKAAAEMAAQLEALWPGPLEGVVVTRYGHAVPCRQVRVLEAAHPVPDQNGIAAARAMHAALAGLSADDLVISLISGGGSALLVEPVAGISLADKQQLTRDMFQAGATIRELNRVRQALSLVKGGRLAAAAWPAQVLTLVISDVPGDDPALVASGPTVPPSCADHDDAALAIVERLGVNLPAHVRKALQVAVPLGGDFSHCRTELIATPMQSLQAAARRAAELGYAPLILGDCIEGEAREVAQMHAGIALSAQRYGQPLAGPAVILSGGETKVSFGAVTPGRGGRNTEFLLALGLALRGAPGIHAIACDTDGVDGSEDNAGALWLDDSAARARRQGVDMRGALERHDAYRAFAALGDLVACGPTHTNVNDFRAMLIEPKQDRI
ncbi:glycerate kinase type-2 family protein [Janthinobacterium agaricidamnosum]|uniref:MOFRL family protein n=1 Tax=Janthinobacterium agaricidamnosum NBRC 102515 = DSM 9628 TaxID=1349767 RepID=W0V5F9_9BURK|nr:glycerate kinase [Janthinobacterium agaricidamnosum]CDG84059.1 MOFRL family protein [Janthinobacterium agaricidamnosum NBRC 102515 = DSM 9628]